MVKINEKQKNQRFFGNNFLRKNRKGEITTKQIVTLIILILSFSVILFLIFRLDLGQITNEEICRNSVVLKGESKLGIGGTLDCRTSYICISGGGDCEGINPTKTIEISSKDDDEKKNEVMNALAEEMASCWNQFGEGEIDYGGGGAEHRVQYAICSTIAFDENVQGKVSITYDEFYEYLRTNKKSDSQTYLQYIYATSILEGLDDEEHFKFSLSEPIDTSQRYSIITGVDKNIWDFLDDDEILKVYMIPTSEISSRLTESRNFITKA